MFACCLRAATNNAHLHTMHTNPYARPEVGPSATATIMSNMSTPRSEPRGNIPPPPAPHASQSARTDSGPWRCPLLGPNMKKQYLAKGDYRCRVEPLTALQSHRARTHTCVLPELLVKAFATKVDAAYGHAQHTHKHTYTNT